MTTKLDNIINIMNIEKKKKNRRWGHIKKDLMKKRNSKTLLYFFILDELDLYLLP